MFFEMLAGAKPFNGENVYQILQSHIHADIPPLPEHVARFQRIIDRLMAKAARDRYATATAALLAVEAACSKIPDVEPAGLPAPQARVAAGGDS
jgi:serine/threonine-protein kinase PpkA